MTAQTRQVREDDDLCPVAGTGLPTTRLMAGILIASITAGRPSIRTGRVKPFLVTRMASTCRPAADQETIRDLKTLESKQHPDRDARFRYLP